MKNVWIRICLFAAAILMVLAFVQSAGATWHVLLDEHFARNQQFRANWWPWVTDVRNGYRWHYNPRPAYYLSEPVTTDYTWGVQDYIYNTHITRNEDWPMSIWCARTNRNDAQNPNYPADTTYFNNQNAWVWWGPIDLRRAVKGAVSYWYYMDVGDVDRDSMSVVMVDDAGLLTLDGNDFHRYVPWGKVHKIRTVDWQQSIMYFDSLYLGEDTISFVGDNNLWVAWVWHTNERNVTGTGAYVDDVVIRWDDGLFDVFPLNAYYGYPVGEDTVQWSRTEPVLEDEIFLRLDWDVGGSQGEIPPFYVNLFINDTLWHSELYELNIEPDDSIRYSTITDSVWTVVPGNHTFRWVLDAEDAVEEGDCEDNNIVSILLDIIYNPPPQMEIFNPFEVDSVKANVEDYVINYTIDDSIDVRFQVHFYWTFDTTGLAEDPMGVIFGYPYHQNISSRYDIPLGDNIAVWNIEKDVDNDVIHPGDEVFIVALATDYQPGNLTWAVSPGKVHILPPNAAPGESIIPGELALGSVYPNPFNRAVSLSYSLPVAQQVRLGVYDLAGREVALLVDGMSPAGTHQISWVPNGIPGGVYMVRMTAGGSTFMQKAVYMP